MKHYFLLWIAAIVLFSATAQASSCRSELPNFFQGKPGCFLLYNLSKRTYETTYGGATCNKSVSPASTFKIVNSLIGLDLGILKDENTLYHWDGSKQFMKSHEHDHTLATAVRDSVVWYFQAVAKQVGEAHYHEYLKRFDYGNQDISGGLTQFWLGRSLKISPKGQIDFLAKFYRNQLPVSSHASSIVKKILVLETSSHKVLSGKTGTASVEGDNIGWFVGHLLSGDTEYLFATMMMQKGTDYKIDNDLAGPRVKALTKEILTCKGLL